MNKNFVMLAQNSSHDYVEQASVCAMSIHLHVPDAKISLITNDPVPDCYAQLFDNVVDIPWGDLAEKHEWKIHNRWKILHAMPYDNALVLDTDMLILEDISHWFKFLSKYDLFYTTNVKTYRNDIITGDFYRKNFVKHQLPNLYAGIHYVNKTPFTYQFNSLLDKIIQNWNEFAGYIQKNPSIDVAAGLTAKLLDCESQITNSQSLIPSFTHVKPNIQGWASLNESWQKQIGSYFTDDLELWIGNYKQSGVFHYTEKDFLNDEIIKKYKTKIGI